MPECVLLRFRDLVRPTVEAHNERVKTKGSALWGWWKKPAEPMPDPGLSALSEELDGGQRRILFVDSGTRTVYEAPLKRIVYVPGGKLLPPPTPELCPEYYRDKEFPAWFEVGTLQSIGTGLSALDQYVWSESNRTSRTKSITALASGAVGEIVTDDDFLDSNLSLWFVMPINEFGLAGRASLVPPVSRGVWPTTGNTIVHISDLHFGAKHGFRNHLAKGVDRLGEESVAEALLDDLEALGLSKNGVAALFVTGDLTWAGEAHEFENAFQMLQTLSKELGLHTRQVVVVPGNHDIEWRNDRDEIDDNAELNYHNFASKFYGAPSNAMFYRIHRLQVANKTVSCLALNSCRIERKANAGLGFVGRQQLAAMAKDRPSDAA